MSKKNWKKCKICGKLVHPDSFKTVGKDGKDGTVECLWCGLGVKRVQ